MQIINGLEHIDEAQVRTDHRDGELMDVLTMRDGSALVITSEDVSLYSTLSDFINGEDAAETMPR